MIECNSLWLFVCLHSRRLARTIALSIYPPFSFIHIDSTRDERHVAHFGIDIDNRTICVYHGFNFGMCSGRMLCVLKVKWNVTHVICDCYIAMCGPTEQGRCTLNTPAIRQHFWLLPLQLHGFCCCCCCCCIFFTSFSPLFSVFRVFGEQIYDRL